MSEKSVFKYLHGICCEIAPARRGFISGLLRLQFGDDFELKNFEHKLQSIMIDVAINATITGTKLIVSQGLPIIVMTVLQDNSALSRELYFNGLNLKQTKDPFTENEIDFFERKLKTAFNNLPIKF
jgi:hypothetical protein